MSAKHLISLIACIPALTACGLRVPDNQENPFANELDRTLFVEAIARNVRCEVQDAVVRLYADQKDAGGLRNLAYFDTWAAQVSLTLTTDEKGSLGPVANITPPGIFNLGLAATASSEAQRVDKIGYFFTVAELKKYQACPAADRNKGPFLMQSDLKLHEWLDATMVTTGLNDTPAPTNVTGPQKSNVLSHEVKFDIITSGSVTPGWKLTTATVNQSGNFLSASRDRTQDLTITFGPIDPAWLTSATPKGKKPGKGAKGTPIVRVGPAALGAAAQSAIFASDVGNAITNGVRNGLR